MKTAIKQRLASVLSTPVDGSCKKGVARFIFKATDTWVEPGTTPDTVHLENHILNLTGGTDLADARRIFYADPLKRTDTLLGNADSVAWLITQLGRQLDPVPSSRPVSPLPCPLSGGAQVSSLRTYTTAAQVS